MLAKAFARKSQRDFYACEVAHAQQSESKLSLRSLNRNIAAEFEKYDGLVAQLDRATAF